MSTSERVLAPEDSPTYLNPGERVSPEKLEMIRERMEEWHLLQDMFQMPGWRVLEARLREREQEAIAKLTGRNGVRDLDEVYAHRERLSLIQALLNMEAETARQLRAGQEALAKAGG